MTTDIDAFRAEVRRFIADNLPRDVAERTLKGYHPHPPDVRAWTRILDRRGWSVPNWPAAHGGPGWTVLQRHVFDEECFLAGAPALSPQGVHLVGPIIYAYGNDEQKARFLPPIRTADHLWAQGFSEPNAGSDLASLKTRAELVDDHYVVNGQKIWTSDAHHADWLFLLVRTDTSVKPQAGISFLLVDLATPGISVRPIPSIDEGHILNEVFLDNVRVPAANLIGEPGKGWTYAKALLSNERSFSAEVPRCKGLLARLRDGASRLRVRGRPVIEDPAFRARVAELEIELEAIETMVWRVVDQEDRGVHDGAPLASVLKVRGTELIQRIGALMVETLGDHALPAYPEADYLVDPPADPPGPDFAPGVVADFMYRRSATIYGGANEVQRNIIASALLRG